MTPRPASDRRVKELARIHVAAKRLGLDEASYRALLDRVAGVRSAADLDAAGRRAVIREFTRLGSKVGEQARRQAAHAGRPKGLAERPMLRKVEALLADAQRPWEYAHSMARHMFRVSRVEWLHDYQLHGLVAALQIDAQRRGQRVGEELL